jgi:hypothetical protein
MVAALNKKFKQEERDGYSFADLPSSAAEGDS